MTQDRREALKSILSEAIDLAENERAEFLARSLPQPEERAEVERLLAWHAEDYLAEPALRINEQEQTIGIGLDAGSGDEQFGPYTIIRELGRGGMGTVYLAERHDELAGYPVALKVIPSGAGGTDLEARLRIEMQALTKLKHPNIVSVLDAGVSTYGRVYFAMEYVEGCALDVFCREHDLYFDARLRLFVRICEAVAHAHQNLVIHRDVKPSNILVTAEGAPKLLDFGLATIVTDDTDTLTTAGQWRASLRYASPEQVKGVPLTTATDVYSLGVVLFELLTGANPYGSDTDPVQLMRAVLAKDPVFPEGFDPDVAAILSKTLRKEPAARYSSVEELKRDIEHYLGGLPVGARRGNTAYIFGKFVRRNSLPLGLALAVLSLVATAGLGWWTVQRSNRDYDRAVSAAKTLSMTLGRTTNPQDRTGLSRATQELADLLMSGIERPGLGRNRSLDLISELTGIAELLGHPASPVSLGDVEAAIHILRTTIVEAERLYATSPTDPRASECASRSNRCLGTILIEENDYTAAAALFRRAAEIDLQRLNLYPENPEPMNTYADSLANLSRISFHDRKADECLRLGKESVEFRRKAVLSAQAAQRGTKRTPNPADADAPSQSVVRRLAESDSQNQVLWKDLGAGISNYCADLVEFEHFEEALDACQESTRILMEVVPLDSFERLAQRLIANNAEHSARAYSALGRDREALAHIEKSVKQLRALQRAVPLDATVPEHLARSLAFLAEAQFKAGQKAAARASATEAVRLALDAAASDPANKRDRIAFDQIRARMNVITGRAR